jgi:hypothetical protein
LLISQTCQSISISNLLQIIINIFLLVALILARFVIVFKIDLTYFSADKAQTHRDAGRENLGSCETVGFPSFSSFGFIFLAVMVYPLKKGGRHDKQR